MKISDADRFTEDFEKEITFEPWELGFMDEKDITNYLKKYFSDAFKVIHDSAKHCYYVLCSGRDVTHFLLKHKGFDEKSIYDMITETLSNELRININKEIIENLKSLANKKGR